MARRTQQTSTADPVARVALVAAAAAVWFALGHPGVDASALRLPDWLSASPASPAAELKLPADVLPLAGLRELVPDTADRQHLAALFAEFAALLEADGREAAPKMQWLVQAAGGESLDDLRLPSGRTLGQQSAAYDLLRANFKSDVGDVAKETLDAERRAKSVLFWQRAAAALR